ncbi:MAG: hypothetical protein CVU39_14390 [Chloroflexi bacterium HGW-Chloroflexi-10]|nr:MAG: hypothetical protein CVU39_14390 [Chloroflexi bacterium HGW-Chloroflexi-10]
MPDLNHSPKDKPRWKGFSLQLFLITVLPLALLVLVVAFGSQNLHHEAMRSLVGDRDLRAVNAAVNNLERELNYRAGTIRMEAARLDENQSAWPDEIATLFDVGIVYLDRKGNIINAVPQNPVWQNISTMLPGYLETVVQKGGEAVFSQPFNPADGGPPIMLVAALDRYAGISVGGFTPSVLIEKAVSSLTGGEKTTVMVVAANPLGGTQTLYHSGTHNIDEHDGLLNAIQASLNGQSGIQYHHNQDGESIIAYSTVPDWQWGLLIEEAWEDISSPYLRTTQSAPLILVPVFLLALVALWFGARRIEKPLKDLEKQASSLAKGNFAAIHEPVGGIAEIRNLQLELIDMAEKLSAAQQSLRSYIGDITAGIENERRSLARELHDDTIQSLIVLNQRIQLAAINAAQSQKESLGELQTLAQITMNNLRQMIRGLRPIYLEDLGLVPALEMLARESSQTGAIPIVFQAEGPEHRLPAQTEVLIYRMVQEALSNVIRHAKATHAWVTFTTNDHEVILQIRDNGQGFRQPNQTSEFSQKGHFGLLGLHERAEIINADLQIESVIGEGTSITIHLGRKTQPEET